MADNVAATASVSQALGTRNCTDLSYHIKVPTKSFDAKHLSEAIHAKVDYQGWYAALRGPQNTDITDYHIHVAWKSDDDETHKNALTSALERRLIRSIYRRCLGLPAHLSSSDQWKNL